MSKQSGLGANFLLGATDLSGDVGAIGTIAGPRNTQNVTSINKAAMERLVLRSSGQMAFTGFWNPTLAAIVDVLNDMPRTDLLATIAIPTIFGAFAVGDPAVSLVAKQIGFDQTFGEDGSLGIGTSLESNGHTIEWGQLLTTGQQSFATGTVSGTSIDRDGIDYTTSTAFGAAAYLHVVSHGSGTATFTIQDSADNSSFTAISGMAFTAVTGATSERIQVGLTDTVRRYVRVQKTGTSTATVATINFVRYLTSQAS